MKSQDLKNMDAEVIFSKQLKQIEKEKRDKEIKLKTQEKKVLCLICFIVYVVLGFYLIYIFE